ncbi:MAG: ABC transporter ATP-binding protein [Desulfobacteraceae bacterium]|nr:ABC transporter ATP-binding protein [Desulfobacteraceae bacterium]
MLQVSGVTKQFGLQTIFSDFSLSVPENGFTVLLGPSGCGKSTLFDLLTGVVPADTGALAWRGGAMPHLGAVAAYMQQKDLLLPWFSLMDNALLPVKAVNGDVKEARNRAMGLFERLGLKGYESHMPHEVSGGMGQRCALVRTLMFERDLVLLDEPLSALDAITRQTLQALLLLLQTEFDKTLVMITHDIEEALLLADDLVLLTPRPMAVRERFVLKIPKPRRFDDPELLALKSHVLGRLTGEDRDASF